MGRDFFRGKVKLDPKGFQAGWCALPNDCSSDVAEAVLQAYFRTVKGSETGVPSVEGNFHLEPSVMDARLD